MNTFVLGKGKDQKNSQNVSFLILLQCRSERKGSALELDCLRAKPQMAFKALKPTQSRRTTREQQKQGWFPSALHSSLCLLSLFLLPLSFSQNTTLFFINLLLSFFSFLFFYYSDYDNDDDDYHY